MAAMGISARPADILTGLQFIHTHWPGSPQAHSRPQLLVAGQLSGWACAPGQSGARLSAAGKLNI